MKIVILSTQNFSPPAWEITKALRKHAKHQVKLIKDSNKFHNSPCDICLDELVTKKEQGPQSIVRVIRNKSLKKAMEKMDLKPAQDLIDAADVIIFKTDKPPTPDWYNLNIPGNKPIISLVGGSAFRRKTADTLVSLNARGEHPISTFLVSSHLRAALTPDLNYPEFDGIYTQAAIDSRSQKKLWRKREVPIIMHSPSNRKRKGTDDIFLPAMDILREKGYKFKVEIIEKTTRENCIDAKKRATIFFDQAHAGFYGMSALEAMQFGIPTVAYVSSDAIKQSGKKINTMKCPVVMIEPTIESCVRSFERLLKDPEKLKKRSERTKKFCDDFHSYEAVSKMWDEIFKKLLKNFNKKSVLRGFMNQAAVKQAGNIPVKRGNKKGIIADLKQLKDIFDSCRVPFVMQEGNVLGYARYKDIMEWDLDIDIGVYTKISEKKKAELLRALRLGGCGIGKNESGDFIYGKRNVKLNLWFWHREGDFFVARPKTSDKIFILKAEHFLHPKEIDFLGRKFLIPDPLDGYLDLRYGKNWKHTIITDDAKWKEVEKKIKKTQKLMPWHEFPTSSGRAKA